MTQSEQLLMRRWWTCGERTLSSRPLLRVTGLALSCALAGILAGCSHHSSKSAISTTSSSSNRNAPTLSQVPGNGYKHYSNTRFRYSLELPSSLAEDASNESSGITEWRSSDRTAVVQVLGTSNSAVHQTSGQQLAQCKKQLTSSGGEVSLARQSGGTYTCSGNRPDKTLYYEHGAVGHHYMYVVIWIYARTAVARWSAALQHSVSSFKPGPL